jgi:hypothetical protein
MINMKKNKLLLFLFILPLLSGCSLFHPLRSYHDKENHFSILLPMGWRQEKGFTGVTLLVRDPKNYKTPERFQANINVIVKQMPAQVSFENFFELNREEIESTVPGIRNMEDGHIFAGLHPGKSLYFESKLSSIVLKFNTAAWFVGGRVYIVTCAASEEDYRSYGSMFMRVMKSIRFK